MPVQHKFRNASIVMDYIMGSATMSELADRHDVHVSRIDQILKSSLNKICMNVPRAKADPIQCALRLRDQLPRPAQWLIHVDGKAVTCEGFHYELMSEERRRGQS
jgi:hypothetical protein